MKHYLLYAIIAVVSFFSFHANGQNLVPNPSFEDVNACPASSSGLAYSPTYIDFPTVKAWSNPLKDASPDYFNSCALTLGVSVPQNSFGYQNARTGKGYAGIIAWEARYQGGVQTLDYSEYIQCKLTQPLQQGERYCVTFFVNAAVVQSEPFNYVGIDEMGINLSPSKTSVGAGYTLNLPYSVINPSGNFLTDTINWTKISEIYTAQGGEEWLTLGRFKKTANPNIQPIHPAIPQVGNNTRAYLFIDDVSVIKLKNVDTTFVTHDSSYCLAQHLPMVLTSSGQDGDYYLWSTGATTKDITITKDGKYWCTSFANCHTYIDTFIVQYRHPEKLSLGNQIVNCKNEPVTINTSIKFDTYVWNTGATSDKIIVSKTGVYTLTATNRCGTQKDSVHVFIQPPTPQPQVNDTTVCQFSQPVLNVKGENLQWYANAAGVVGGITQPAVITQEPGYYDLYVSQKIGMCESPKKRVRINVTYTPHEELEDDEIMCQNAVKTIGNELPYGVLYKWNTGDFDCCIKPYREGMYKRSTRNECGSYIDTVYVGFSLCEDCLVLPNAFTPNGDGSNDEFKPIVTCPVAMYTMSVYNRWGELVFKTDDVHTGWRGTVKGQPANMGTYLYIIEYRAQSTKRDQFLKGNITLLR